jgi:hypothetical protein
MTMQATATGKDKDRVIGYLTWWTIHKGAYSVRDLLEAAQQAGLGSYVTSRIRGRDPKAAFFAATQTGSKGLLIRSASGIEERLITKEAEPNAKSAQPRRALVHQVTQHTSEIRDVVNSKTAAVIEFDPGTMANCRTKVAPWAHLNKDVIDAINDIEEKIGRLVGTMDDGRIRTIVIGWLKLKYRIAVRGTGGVYFVPAPSDPTRKSELEGELMAMREWMTSFGAPFSVVALNESGALSMEDFVQDAIGEVKDELQDIATKLDSWGANDSMNAGSRMFSSETQHKRIEAIKDKVRTLKESLGEQVGIVDNMLALLSRRVGTMLDEATEQVKQEKAERQEAKASAKKGKSQKGKKAGTAASRSKKQKIE